MAVYFRASAVPVKKEKGKKAATVAWQSQDAARDVPQLAYLPADELKTIQELPRHGPELGIKLDTIRTHLSVIEYRKLTYQPVKHIQALRRADTDAKIILCKLYKSGMLHRLCSTFAVSAWQSALDVDT